MARGRPDFGLVPMTEAANMVDLAALYQGLTGLVSVDGFGRLVWLDTFHQGLSGLTEFLEGDAGAASITTDYAYVQGAGLKVPCGTIAGLGHHSRFKSLITPTASNIGIEVAVLLKSTLKVRYKISMQYTHTYGHSYYAGLSYDTVSGKIVINTPTGSIQLEVLPVVTQDALWYPMKLVMNTLTGKYVRCVVGKNGYSLSDYDCGSTLQEIPGGCTFGVDLYPTDNVAGRYGIVGYVMFTTDEP